MIEPENQEYALIRMEINKYGIYENFKQLNRFISMIYNKYSSCSVSESLEIIHLRKFRIERPGGIES